jgi:hypothetical protein
MSPTSIGLAVVAARIAKDDGKFNAGLIRLVLPQGWGAGGITVLK